MRSPGGRRRPGTRRDARRRSPLPAPDERDFFAPISPLRSVRRRTGIFSSNRQGRRQRDGLGQSLRREEYRRRHGVPRNSKACRSRNRAQSLTRKSRARRPWAASRLPAAPASSKSPVPKPIHANSFQQISSANRRPGLLGQVLGAKSHPAAPGGSLQLFDLTQYLNHRTSPSGWILLSRRNLSQRPSLTARPTDALRQDCVHNGCASVDKILKIKSIQYLDPIFTREIPALPNCRSLRDSLLQSSFGRLPDQTALGSD